MRNTCKHQAEEWFINQASACFIFSLLIGMVWFPVCLQGQEQEQANPLISIIGYPSFTPKNTFRFAEGELVLFWGENKIPIKPEHWQSPETGKIVFSVLNENTLLNFEAAYAQTLSASNTIAGMILNCTASRLGTQQANPIIWSAWRHKPDQDQTAYGAVLIQSTQEKIEKKTVLDPWKSTLTWRFVQSAYCRENNVLYWIGQHEGWDISHHVRHSQPPYITLEQESLTGWTKFSTALKTNQPASFHIFIPYSSVPLSQYISE